MAIFSFPALFWLPAATFLIVTYSLVCIRSYRRLSHIPGPKLYGWSNLPLIVDNYRGVTYEKYGQLGDEYGSLVRIGPNMLLTSDPDILRRINVRNSPYKRSKWYLAMRLLPGTENVLSILDDGVHDALRRKMSPGYSGKENIYLEKDIDDGIRDFIALIDRKYTSKDDKIVPMEFARKAQFLTIDIMSKLAFNFKFGDLKDDEDKYGYIEEIETAFPAMFCTTLTPRLLQFLTDIGLLQAFSPKESSKFGFGKMYSICKERVAARFDASGKVVEYPDMMGSFQKHGLSRQQLEQESMMQLIAGSDTTASAIRATMLCLLTHPHAYNKLMAEITEAIKSGMIPSGEDEIISDAQASRLPYLQAVIKEGLRWYPPIAGLAAKETPPEGDTLNGYWIPGGTSIGYNAKLLHHNPLLFSPDPQSFRPERWLPTTSSESSDSKLRAMERNNELIFGYGKYGCLGKNVALVELNKVFVEVLRRFECRLLDVLKPWESRCWGMHMQRGLWVAVKRRNGVVGEEVGEKEQREEGRG